MTTRSIFEIQEGFRPMLSPQDDPLKNPKFFEKLPYPLLVSPKIDGIRGANQGGVVYSRTLKPLPSFQVQDEFCECLFGDGEIIEGCITDFDVYNRTQSHVMSRDKPGDLSYNVFDCCDTKIAQRPFEERLELIERLVKEWALPNVFFVAHELVENYDELLAYEERNLVLGFEGIMMRTPWGHYKHNRATYLDQLIYKLKRFTDDEGLLLDVLPAMENNNPQVENELGRLKRSKAKAGLTVGNIAGKLILSWQGIELEIGLGNFSHEQRRDLLVNRLKYIGKVFIKFRYFGHGVKDLPRQPRALGFRDLMDM